MAERHLSVTGGNNKTISVWKMKKREKSKQKEESDGKSKLHWWTLGLKGGGKVEGEGRWRRERRLALHPSDRQRDEAIVLLDVAFEDV